MTTRDDRDLNAPGRAPQPFEPGVFDDALDAYQRYQRYQRYEGPLTPEAMAAARKKATELDLVATARRAGTSRPVRRTKAAPSYRTPRSERQGGIAAHSRSDSGEKSVGTRARSAITGRFVKQSTATRHPKTTVIESTKPKKK